MNEGETVLLRCSIYRMDDEQALIEIASMEGPYSLRVPLSQLRPMPLPVEFPQQPLVNDDHGVARFKENRIVSYLLEEGPTDMNDLAIMAARGDFTNDERMQFAQLIGYSVAGYCDLSYVSEESIEAVDG